MRDTKLLYEKAAAHFGVQSQVVKAIEEMSELQKELCKFLLNPITFTAKNINEEIADVEIMLEQMRLFFDPSKKSIDDIKEEKLNRLKKYMGVI